MEVEEAVQQEGRLKWEELGVEMGMVVGGELEMGMVGGSRE